MIQQTLFEIHRPQRVLKRSLARVLAIANAGASNWLFGDLREDFYALKRRILERYGERDGTDWQEITRPCWGCEDCRDYEDDWYYCGRRDGFCCGGSKVYSRTYIPLARWKLGAMVFHLPGLRQSEKPGMPIVFRERIKHREVNDEDARAAFLQLCLWFDREMFRRTAARLFAVDAIAQPF